MELSRDPALTYRGALQILGRYDRPAIEKLDRLLGGFILGAGAASAAAMLAPALAPLGSLAAVWGWIEQRDEAVRLVRSILDSASKKLLRTGGYERHQLVAAAHTAVVAASFFEALREHLGAKEYKKLAITEAERRSLTIGSSGSSSNGSLIELLYSSQVPAPSSARGFEETIPYIEEWMRAATVSVQNFLKGLACWPSVDRPLSYTLGERAAERYRSRYLEIAAGVPEFLVWASLGEHAATRYTISACRADVMQALEGHTEALARLESILSISAPRIDAERDFSDIIRRANLGVLTEPIISESALGTVANVTFPSVEQMYLNPSYRLGVIGDYARPADDKWWEERPLQSDLDLLLAGYVTAPDATHAPLLLLGHPGVGKSLLTKLVAARLPASAFTTVRVSLRRVHADAPIYEQIQQALNMDTNGRVDWSQLAEHSGTTLRVVLLDGLDELLQAAGHRGGYLQEVVDFQRREAEQRRPVAVLVTSRTVVADRVAIPAGTTVIKLEGFDDGQIATWLETWNYVNARAISSGIARELTTEAALRHVDLARQPLLLLMLALYSADPGSPPLGEDLSSADLYRRILDNFSRREVAKFISTFRTKEFEAAVDDHLWRLSVAAFAMFNRGRQDVTDDELGSDLNALAGGVSAAPVADLGRKLIGQFFFVYVAEARGHGPGDTRRSYEFLHATFGEYLIAGYIIELLSEMAVSSVSTRRGAHEPDDQLLFSFLCHQALATRKTTLNFAVQLMQEFSPDKQSHILSLLDSLIVSYRRRPSSDRYAGYRPMPVDNVRKLAAYSANLVLLRVMLGAEDRLNLSTIETDGNTWRATVALWRSGLDPDGLQAVFATLTFDGGLLRPMEEGESMPAEWTDLLHARLTGDKDAESRLRFGMSIYDRAVYFHAQDSWKEVILSSLIPATSLVDDQIPILLKPERKHASGNVIVRSVPCFDDYDVSHLLQMASRLLFLRSTLLPEEAVEGIIEWMLSFSNEKYRRYSFVTYAFAFALAAYPGLLDRVRVLNNPDLYEIGASLVLDMSHSPRKQRLKSLSEKIRLRHNAHRDADAYNADQIREMVESILLTIRFEHWDSDVISAKFT